MSNKVMTKSELYKINIPTPSGLNEILDILLENPYNPSLNIKPDRFAPCYIYKEWVTGTDSFSLKPFERRVIKTRTSSDKRQGELEQSYNRDVLELHDNYLSDLNRGKILVAFCEIEMIIEILVCYHLGVYSGSTSYENVHNERFAIGKDLDSFDKKKKLLQENNIISDTLAKELYKLQTLRNGISHNYFTDENLGLSSKRVQEYGGSMVAVECRFNRIWIKLLQEYNNHQVNILKGAYHKRLSML